METINIDLSKNGLLLKNIEQHNITYEQCEIAIKQNPFALQYVPNKLINIMLCNIALSKTDNDDIRKYIPDFIIKFNEMEYIYQKYKKYSYHKNYRFYDDYMNHNRRPRHLRHLFNNDFDAFDDDSDDEVEAKTYKEYKNNLKMNMYKLNNIPKEFINRELCMIFLEFQEFNMQQILDIFLDFETIIKTINKNIFVFNVIPETSRYYDKICD